MARPRDEELFIVEGAPRTPVRDLYHVFLRVPGWVSLAMIVVRLVALNVLFALVYVVIGGVAHARPGSLMDAFFFSVQTMGTIGYGAMYPETTLANAVVAVEALTGIVATAVATGLIFAKVTQSTSRINFSELAAVSPMDGVPTLMFRVGNERGNLVMDAQLRVVVAKTVTTREGTLMYRMLDLKMVRDRTPALTRTWTVMHHITPDSPLYGMAPEDLEEHEVELMVTLVGTDDTTLLPVHGRARYEAKDIRYGHRLADVLDLLPDGRVRVMLQKFHDLVPAEPVAWATASESAPTRTEP
ncbi:MAG: ATP-sensitive inward rectifier potassium channel 10 [Alphaproteobacteria bacterium]|nr:ATP-sensitive inward rectifier potassium channel 10 [Alphaproteobacteria bacterium]